MVGKREGWDLAGFAQGRGDSSPLVPEGAPVVRELNRTDLSIEQPLRGGGMLTMVCRETRVTCEGVDGHGEPLRWAWDIVGGERQKSVVRMVTPRKVGYHGAGVDYELKLARGGGLCEQLDNGTIRLSPNHRGKLDLILDAASH